MTRYCMRICGQHQGKQPHRPQNTSATGRPLVLPIPVPLTSSAAGIQCTHGWQRGCTHSVRLHRLRCDHRNGNETSNLSNGTDAAQLEKLPEDTSALGIEELGKMVGVEEMPPEVEPLAECFKRASARVEEASSVREALEAEAQEVAQLAVQARENANKSKNKLEEAKAEVKAAGIVLEKLQTTIESLTVAAAEEGSSEGPTGAAALLVTRELEGTSDEEDEAVGGAAVGPAGPPPQETPSAKDLLVEKEGSLLEIKTKLVEYEAKVEELTKRCQITDLAADKAEQVAAAAMSAAEAAVRDEMEAAAVAKESQVALVKALQEIRVLEDTKRKAEKDEETRAKQKQAAEAAKEGSKLDPTTAAVAKSQDLDAPRQGTSSGGLGGSGGGVGKERKEEGRVQEEGKAPQLISYQDDVPTSNNPLMEFVQRNKLPVMALAALLASYIIMQTPAGAGLRAKAAAVLSSVTGVAQQALAQLPAVDIPHGVEDYLVTIWLLLTACVAVPLVCQLPGGSAVLGFLVGGACVGPHAFGIIKDVEHVRHIAELGVVFLLFNIGLELSLERLQSMQKFVFGMGSAQVLTTLAFVAYFAHAVMGMSGPAAIILGGGLALSSTAVAMQVLQDRGENGSRHGRATFSVLLFQDLAVVVLLMLVPLLAPSDSSSGGLQKIANAIGVAGVKAIACITGIIIGGRTLLRPLYRAISNVGNQEIFAATTLLVVMGTSVLTQIAGLSLALGAFLAGLLLAETEFHLQVESDIAPYKGLLMGLFFMTVGMEISVGLFFAKWKTVLAGISLLILGKTAVVAAVGGLFGLSITQATRAGLLLAPGGEFAFVLLGEAMGCGLMSNASVREIFLVVALSMALTPYLAEFGQKIGRMFEKNDVKALQPNQAVVDELRNHVIIAGFGRVGQLIAQLLSERLIPFVALDVSSDRVQAGKELDLPVYFGDAGSAAVLHSVGAHRASCAVITLDTPGANYRSVWALNKNFPQVKTFVRAHDVDHGVVLEKAGATAVVPETLEPSLQLAAAVLSEYSMPEEEVANAIRSFRKSHLKELQLLAVKTRSSLGYGFATRDEEGSDEEEDFVEEAGVAAPAL